MSPQADSPDLAQTDEERAYNRGWADGSANALDACYPIIERLQSSVGRLQQALRVASHEPHDQAGEPVEGFPVCSVCGAIQVESEPPDPEPIQNETASGYARRVELVAAARADYTPLSNDYGDDE